MAREERSTRGADWAGLGKELLRASGWLALDAGMHAGKPAAAAVQATKGAVDAARHAASAADVVLGVLATIVGIGLAVIDAATAQNESGPGDPSRRRLSWAQQDLNL